MTKIFLITALANSDNETKGLSSTTPKPTTTSPTTNTPKPKS